MELAKEYVINDPEDLLPCPYDAAHMVRAKRLAYHIAKCRVHHVCTEMSRCPYNASHEVFSVELRYHMAICEDKQRVQGKIAQEHSEREGEVKGCIETPGYKPLNIWGDSWEDETTTESCFTRGKVELKEQPKPELEEEKAEEVSLTDAEKHGLTGRQVQKLYLQKQAELRQAREQAAQRKPAVEEKLRVPRQASQSLAIHHQQQHRQQQDIYQQALKGQQDRALGRGRGLLLGTNPLQAGGTVPGAGRGGMGNITTQPQNMGPLHAATNGNVFSAGHANPQNSGVCQPAGRGWGNVNANAPSVGVMGGRPPSQGMVDVTNLIGPAGRGIGLVPTQMAAGSRPVGVIGDMRSAGRPPVAVGAKTGGSNPQGEAVALPHMAASMGRGAGSALLMNPGAVGMLQGCPGAENTRPQHNGSAHYPQQSQQYMSSSSETEDDSQYQDAPAWVGGGYGGDLDPSPSFSLSSTSVNSNFQAAAASGSDSAASMASNPRLVGSWADEVDKSFPMPAAVVSSDSLSSDSDFPDVQRTETVGEATKQLRKIRKKLRQIDELDAKRRQGIALDPQSESKIQSRATLIAQATHLQQKFGLP